MERIIALTLAQYMLFTALCILLGTEDKEWINCLVDDQEWTLAKYGHQN